MIDKAVTAPAQVFGEGNTANVKIHPIPRNDRANIMVTSYLDADLSYRQKDVSEQDVQSGEYPIVKTIPLLIGCDRETEARRYLRYLIKQNRYVGDMITFDAGPDALEVQVGDVFAFQSQANDFMFSGRIKEVSGSNVIIDQTFTPTGGVTYKWTLWGVNGTVYTRTGTLTGTNIDYLPTPTGFTQTDPYSSPYIITKVSTGETWFRALKVSRSGKTANASITGIEYRSEVYTED
jgi:predicted phage tail protein